VGAFTSYLFNRKLERERRVEAEEAHYRQILWESGDKMQEYLTRLHAALTALWASLKLVPGTFRDMKGMAIRGRCYALGSMPAALVATMPETDAVVHGRVSLAIDLKARADAVTEALVVAQSWLLQRSVALGPAEAMLESLLLGGYTPGSDAVAIAAMLTQAQPVACELLETETKEQCEKIDRHRVTILAIGLRLQRTALGVTAAQEGGNADTL